MTNKQAEEVIRKFREKFELHDLGKDEFTLCCNNDDGTCDGGISILKESQGEAERHLKNVEQFILTAIKEAEERGKTITGETSDGYHTFNELYEFRKLYNAALFNQWADLDLYEIHKSKKHFDGEDCFGGGWFIVMATLPTGQISNHYELKDWDLFRCEERERADKWDGHTAQDVATRLEATLKSK